ncbi:MAG: hypothetical protein ACKVHE_26430 [Planctomycetales bacterium]
MSESQLAATALSHAALWARHSPGKVFPNYLFALTGNFYSTGPVSTSDIAKKMALFRAHFVS